MARHPHFICLLFLVVTVQSAAAAASSFWEPIEIVNDVLDRAVSLVFGQKRSNIEGPENRFRDRLLNDESNDSLQKSTPQEILVGAGYRYRNYYAKSNDGYITQLIRIINPLANRTLLKQPPVMFIHGGLIDQSSFIWCSTIQHHPEIYPRTGRHGPITSSNRSLAFMLANNGYDVWLVGTRGANKQSQGHVKFNLDKIPEEQQILAVDGESKKYFRYSMDEIIEYEVPRQMDKVLQVTGAKNVSIVALSLGTQIALGLLSSNPTYAAKTHTYISLGTILNQDGTNLFVKLVQKTLCRSLPDEIGISLFTQLLTSALVRDLIRLLGSNTIVRYTLLWALLTGLAGPSPTYQSWLEMTVLGHFGQPLGFVEAKHYCQQVVAGRLQKFDYGVSKNLEVYGSLKPPIYDLSNMRVENWAIVSGGSDNLATPASAKQVIREAASKPKEIIHIPHFNHYDLIGGVENDRYANLPMFGFLERYHF